MNDEKVKISVKCPKCRRDNQVEFYEFAEVEVFACKHCGEWFALQTYSVGKRGDGDQFMGGR